jgi:anion-transporting  ArsA/GET3 family ATPase
MAVRSAKVFIVTGKGGVGKSYVSRSLAEGSARAGLRTAWVSLGSADCGRRQAGPGVAAVAIDPRQALASALTKMVRFRLLSRRLMDSRTFTAVAAAAPGLGDLVTLSAIADLASRDQAGTFDSVVVDGPASGQTVALISSAHTLKGLPLIGPLRRMSEQLRSMVTDPRRLSVVITTTAEELPVAETFELQTRLSALGVSQAARVVNAVYPDHGNHGQREWIAAAGAFPDAALHIERRRRQLASLEVLGDPTSRLLLPYSFTGVAEDAVAEDLWAKIGGPQP